jgi:hypothetical protein
MKKNIHDPIIEQVSEKTGLTAEQLKQHMKEKNAEGILKNLSFADSSKIQKILNDPKKAEKIMNSPQAQALFKKLSEK